MKHWTEDDEQVRMFRERMDGVGVSRRDFLAMLAAAAATAASGVFATACTNGTEEARPEGGTTEGGKEELDPNQVFRYYTLVDPISFDLNKSNLSGGSTTTFAGLLNFNPNFEVVPWVAERFTVNADGTLYTFYLRKDAKWTNGDPVTAHDFLWSWTRSLDPATGNPYPSYLFDIKGGQDFNAKKIPASGLGMKVLDDYTLEVQMEGPRGFFPLMVAYTSALPSHKATVLKYGDDKWTEPDKIVSNGYYKLTSWEHNKQYILEPFENWWGRKPKLKKVIVAIAPMDSGLLPYENNELDYRAVPAQEIKRVMADPKLSKEVYQWPNSTTWYLVPEANLPPFDNLKVRQALQHSINRETICTQVTQGVWKPAYCYVSPGIPGNRNNDTAKKDKLKYDPKLAVDLLKGTPYEGGKNWPKTTLTMANREPALSNPAVQAIQAMIKDSIGLQVEIQIQDTRVFFEQIYKHENQMTMVSWIADYPDPHNYFYPVFSSRQSRRRHAWKDDNFDDLVEKAATEINQAKRLEMYKQAEDMMDDQAVALWLFDQWTCGLFKPYVQGVAKDKDGNWKPAGGNVYRDALADYYIVKH